MRSSRKPARLVRGIHLVGVVVLEAAAIGGIFWLVAARAEFTEQTTRQIPRPTLRIEAPYHSDPAS